MDDKKENVDYLKLARQILEKEKVRLQFGVAVQFAGYEPQHPNIIWPRTSHDITLIL